MLLLVAAVGAVILARRRAGLAHPREISVADLLKRGDADAAATRPSETMIEAGGPGPAMSITWYLVVSALIFCIGVGGVLTRRNPLVILLCLELMLNAANLALVAFARMQRRHGRADLRADRDGRRRLRGGRRPRPDRRALPPPAADRRR